MIKGTVYVRDYKFEYDGNIHELLYITAKVSYREVYKKNKFKDNGSLLVKNFRDEINQCCNIVKEEIQELFSALKKEERLSIIKDLTIVFNSRKTSLKYALREDIIVLDQFLIPKFHKEYIKILLDIVDEMILFLTVLERLNNSLDSSYIDLELEKNNIFYRSAKLQPVGFFQYLVTKKAFNDLYNRFKPSEEEMTTKDLSYDEDKKIFTYNVFTNNENGAEYKSYGITFKNFFLKALNLGGLRTLSLVKEKFNDFQSETEFSFYLKRNINALEEMLKAPYEIEEEYFVMIKQQVSKLIKKLQQEYKSYFIVTKVGNKDGQCFFKLKGDKSELRDKAIDLHNRLCKHGFLKEESKKMFVNLFIGKTISEKIIWNKGNNQLKLFVDLLVESGKIEGTVKGKGRNTSSNFMFPDQHINDKFFSNTTNPKDKSKMIEIVSKV